MQQRACKICHAITEQEICPKCQVQTGKNWHGYVVIFDPERSKVANKMNIKVPGKYALKVR
ncbi:MAG: DNA-directed RNA polymerase subunit E [Thermoplasmata archaeon HGW-Thermoplasmata-1]|nr:MAG: DNA-directed RNA polymerase subunit E [Thermoplasmata archaeon HGW-Thermoplasmata-1]